MRAIRILRLRIPLRSVSIAADNDLMLEVPMKSECPAPNKTPYKPEDLNAPSSRLLDEKISDNTGAEAKIDSAFAPTGLKNPFWK